VRIVTVRAGNGSNAELLLAPMRILIIGCDTNVLNAAGIGRGCHSVAALDQCFPRCARSSRPRRRRDASKSPRVGASVKAVARRIDAA
jgi:hypothetical protein